ncbi:hypothetical protein [Pantoea agglomerans]|uniref:hypothetical protein n=2 Tax=Enterobacter agglomerans TaxID=549 RepID=UPI003C7B7FDA
MSEIMNSPDLDDLSNHFYNYSDSLRSKNFNALVSTLNLSQSSVAKVSGDELSRSTISSSVVEKIPYLIDIDGSQAQEESSEELHHSLKKDNTFNETILNPNYDAERLGSTETYSDGVLTKPINDFISKGVRKLESGIKKLLAQKVVYFEKHLECYGIINRKFESKDGKTYLDAAVYDIDNNDPLDNITFEVSEFSEDDRKDAIENSIFYWRVGKDHHLYGGDRNVSEFRIRRRVTRITRADKEIKEREISETIAYFSKINNELEKRITN